MLRYIRMRKQVFVTCKKSDLSAHVTRLCEIFLIIAAQAKYNLFIQVDFESSEQSMQMYRLVRYYTSSICPKRHVLIYSRIGRFIFFTLFKNCGKSRVYCDKRIKELLSCWINLLSLKTILLQGFCPRRKKTTKTRLRIHSPQC